MFGFAHTMMLAGTAAGSAPIIIHLLNRQRYKRITWAAMHWLMAAFKKSARRLQIEDLILLIVRVLILVLLALALARPFLQEGGGLFGGASHVHRVVLLDTSFSMGYGGAGHAPFDAAKEAARKLVAPLSGTISSGDCVTLIAVTEQAATRIKASTNLGEVATEVGRTELSHAATDVPKALRTAFEVLDASDHPRKEIFILTDMTRNGWLEPDAAGSGRVRGLDELRKAIKHYADAHPGSKAPGVFLVDVGASEAANTAVTALTADTSIVAAGVKVVFKARARNFSAAGKDELPVAFSVDGRHVSSSVLRVGAGKEAETIFSYQFEEAGPHWVSASVEGDRLPADDARHLAAPVVEHLRILAVDGDMKSSLLESETGLLVQVLSPKVPAFLASQGVRSPSVIGVQVIPNEGLAEAPLDGLDMVILANVPMIPPEKAAQLRSFVRDGGALLVFAGEGLDPANYNEALLAGDDPLLPARLELKAEGVAGDPDARAWTFDPDAETDVMLPSFGRERYPLLKMVRVFRRYRCTVEAPAPRPETPAGADADRKAPAGPAADSGDAKAAGKPAGKDAPVRSKVSVRLRYDDGAPALVVREYGLGKVALFTTTANKRWNNLPERVAHLPMVHDMVRYLVRPRGADHNLEVGGAFSTRWPSEDFAKEVSISPPEGHEEDKTSKRPETVDKATVFRYAGPNDQGVRWAGPYRLTVQGENSPRDIFVANVDPAESDLARIGAEELVKLIPEAGFVPVSGADKIAETLKARTVGREFWKSLAWAVLTLALLETVLAWLFGRGRW